VAAVVSGIILPELSTADWVVEVTLQMMGKRIGKMVLRILAVAVEAGQTRKTRLLPVVALVSFSSDTR
jgi:hypothetical protein